MSSTEEEASSSKHLKSESQTFVHNIKNNNSTDHLIARSVTALKLSKDKKFRNLATSKEVEKDGVKKELSGKDTGESSRMYSIKIDQPKKITAEETKKSSKQNEKSKGILNKFKTLFKF